MSSMQSAIPEKGSKNDQQLVVGRALIHSILLTYFWERPVRLELEDDVGDSLQDSGWYHHPV